MSIHESIFSEMMTDNVVFKTTGVGSSTSSSCVESPNSLDLAEMERVLRSIPEEPAAAFMRKQGKPPQAGYMMVCPAKLKSEFGLFPPNYVVFSDVATSVYILPDLRPGNVFKVPYEPSV